MTVGFERYDEALGILRQTRIDAAHNEFLNILVNQGLIALASYLSALILTALHWRRSARDSIGVMLGGCAVLGYCAQSFFGLSSPITTPFFWCAWGLLCSSIRSSSKNPL